MANGITQAGKSEVISIRIERCALRGCEKTEKLAIECAICLALYHDEQCFKAHIDHDYGCCLLEGNNLINHLKTHFENGDNKESFEAVVTKCQQDLLRLFNEKVLIQGKKKNEAKK